MRSLLKADLRRMLKDKLFFIACIIGAGFALLSSVLYLGLNAIVSSVEDGMPLFYAKDSLAQSFAPLNNFGIAIPIFICIIINKDFSYGTIRNKIICGHSRAKIYLSLFISSTLLTLALILGYTIVSFGVSSILLDYSYTTTFLDDIGYILATIAFGVLGYILLSSFIVFFCTTMKNVGLAIILYMGIAFFLTLAATALFVCQEMLPQDKKFLSPIIDFLCNINIFYLFSNVIGMIDTYTLKEVLYILLDTVIFGSAVTALGIFIFKKKNLK